MPKSTIADNEESFVSLDDGCGSVPNAIEAVKQLVFPRLFDSA
jgi:hypothetical protein